MTRHHGARTVALALSAVALAPATAHAESLTLTDGTGDAKAVDMALALGGLFGPGPGVDEGAPLLVDAPAETSADVSAMTIDHARKRLTLAMTFRDLTELDGHSVQFRILTPQGRFVLPVLAAEGRTVAELSPTGRASMAIANGEVGPGSPYRPCRTVRARYDLAADSLVASVPTACLGSPEWVQVGALVVRTKVTPQPDASANIATFVDDPLRGGVSERSVGLSPKVRRG